MRRCNTCRFGYRRGTPPQSITQTTEKTRNGSQYRRFCCVKCGSTWDNRDRYLLFPLTFRWSTQRMRFVVRTFPAGYKRNAPQIQTRVQLGPLSIVLGANKRMWAVTREEIA